MRHVSNSTVYKGWLTNASGAKAPVADVAIANVDIATGLNIGDSLGANGINGVTFVANDRVLLTAQTDATQNGIYRVSVTGAANRSIDFALDWSIVGSIIPLVGSNRVWMCTNDATLVVGTDDITFDELGATTTVSSASTSQSIAGESHYDFAHNLGSADCTCYTTITTADAIGGQENVPTKVIHIDNNTVRVFNDTENALTFKILVRK